MLLLPRDVERLKVLTATIHRSSEERMVMSPSIERRPTLADLRYPELDRVSISSRRVGNVKVTLSR
ncbi:hypothetical protein D3C81_2145960 [compost metagenome]